MQFIPPINIWKNTVLFEALFIMFGRVIFEATLARDVYLLVLFKAEV